MANFATLLPEVHLRASGAPEAASLMALARATETFCRESWAWQEEVDPLDMELEDDVLTIEQADSSTVPVAVTALRVGGHLLAPVGESAFHAMRSDRPVWPPRGYYTTRPDTVLLLDPVADERIAWAIAELQVTQALAPAPGATSVADFLIHTYAPALISGALYYLATIPGAPSNDPGSVAMYQKEFFAQIAMARRHRVAGYNVGTTRVRPTPLAMGSQA